MTSRFLRRDAPETRSHSLDDLLLLLDRWRHLPAYRLEPRADPFFALFLPHVLAGHLGHSLDPVVIPEFPLRIAALPHVPASTSNLSVKVDYAVFSSDRQYVYLVELKTDQASRRDVQDAYLTAAATVGFCTLVDGVVSLCKATASRSFPKYLHLLHRLAMLGFVSIPDSVYEFALPQPRRGLARAIGQIQNTVTDGGPQIRVLYIQPHTDDIHPAISFEEFAAAIEHLGEIGQLFARHLRRWVHPAGAVDPREAV